MKFSKIVLSMALAARVFAPVAADMDQSSSQLRGATERHLLGTGPNSCSTVTFHTHNSELNSQSQGTFWLLGAGPSGEDIEVPDSCKNALDAQCDINVCPADGILRILATTGDAWQFSIEGVASLVTYRTSKSSCGDGGGGHDGPGTFPLYTKMDLDQFDYYQEYVLGSPQDDRGGGSRFGGSQNFGRNGGGHGGGNQFGGSNGGQSGHGGGVRQPGRSNGGGGGHEGGGNQFDFGSSGGGGGQPGCSNVITFTTDSVAHSESQAKFTIMGYGDVPAACKDTLGASCTLEVCPPDGTLRILANSSDAWRFTVAGVTGLLNYATAPSTCSSHVNEGHQGSGVAPDYTWMDNDQFDLYQQYSF